MRYRSFEANYLISLLSSTLNKRSAPNPVRATDWRELFYLAEYHDVSNLAYYSLIGLYDSLPEIWKNRFSKIFRKWVTINDLQEKDVQSVTDMLEDSRIEYMLLKDWMMKRYYPQPDMRAVQDIGIFVKSGDQKAIRKQMKELGYHHEGLDESGTVAYFKSTRFRIIFYEKLFADNRVISAYYIKIWKKLQSAVGFGSRVALGVDDFYIYMISEMCCAYATAEIDARHIIDLHLYLKKNMEQMDRDYIDTELKKLEFLKMSKCLEDVAALWVGVYEGEETRLCKDVEEYIWSKGTYGLETSIKLLPMIQDMAIWKIRDARKKKIIKVLHWFFPTMEQMKSKFPSVGRWKLLLPVYWMVRLLVMAGFYLKIKFIRARRALAVKLSKKD